MVLRAFIADSPMRATLKATMNFNARHGCLKCTCVGTTIQVGPNKKKIILDSIDAPPRTNVGFRQRDDKAHHKEWCSPLEAIDDFDMVEGMPVSDRLHLLDEGIFQKILVGFLNNTFELLGHIYPRQKEVVSAYIIKIKLPYEIPRRIRSLDEIAQWKATEYRIFFHYLSVVILEDFYQYEGSFNHFFMLFSAITIFSSRAHQQYWSLAKIMLDEFFRHFGKYYGRSNITSNVHNLQHVAHEVEKLGPLDLYSAYDYENNLRFIKQDVKSGTNIVEQVAGRLTERSQVVKAKNIAKLIYPRLRPNGRFFITEDFSLHTQFQNQWFLTEERNIIKFVKAKKDACDSFIIVGDLIESCEELFNVVSDEDNVITDIHLSSTEICIYKVKLNVPTIRVEVPCTSVLCKLVPIFKPSRSLLQMPVRTTPQPNSIALFPLLHTFRNA
uniref:uncharacterized protein LOC125906601 n=1 Tax=Anopheles coluzzii TaxID=1518534 RepID=UPI0020FF9754|nr:uncharacterized protein LOC125906601 [Anopheles coluzzii]